MPSKKNPMDELNKVIAKVKLLSNLLNTSTQWEQDLELE
jgi:hypothetical protein